MPYAAILVLLNNTKSAARSGEESNKNALVASILWMEWCEQPQSNPGEVEFSVVAAFSWEDAHAVGKYTTLRCLEGKESCCVARKHTALLFLHFARFLVR